MALIDIYRKYMYGMPGQTSVDTGDVPATGMSSQGLFGVGGEPGKGGLLTNFQRPNDSGLLNVFSNPFVAIGLEGLQRGMKGQDISTALLPSVKSGLSLTEDIKKIQERNKKRKIIEEYSDQVPEKDKNIFLINPEEYIKNKLLPQSLTADQKNFAAYKRIIETGTDQEKKLAKDIFVKGGRDIKTEQEFLLGVANTLSKDITLNADDIAEKLPEYSKIYNKIVGDIDSSSKVQDILEVPTNKKDLIDGKTYNVNGMPMVWDEKLDRFK